MKFIYQVVGLEDGLFETPDLAQLVAYLEVRGYPYKGLSPYNKWVHAWLIDQPTFEGLMGPMGNGIQGEALCVRYETHEANDILSR